uniref:Uncharacterized protein n=1 Tax=Parascaris equorum TaxID=6256 RepID=A0A914RZM3_PAREQ
MLRSRLSDFEFGDVPSVPTPNARMGNFEDSWLEANVDEGSDGVILFGDDDHGYTLSHTFRCAVF